MPISEVGTAHLDSMAYYRDDGYDGYDDERYRRDDGYYEEPGGRNDGYYEERGPPDDGYYDDRSGPDDGYYDDRGRPGNGYYQERGRPDDGYYGDRGMGPPPPMSNPGMGMDPYARRKKSLLIGINYVGSQHQLQGCHQDVENMKEFLAYQGYPSDSRSQVVMRDDRYTDPRGPFFPNGHNIIAAFNWLVSEPGTQNFLHYSGHGGQVPADDYRSTGYDDTIVPVDFERNGQIPSGLLHRVLVSRLQPNSTLFVIFDCCHSGSAMELPYVFRADEQGNVSKLDNLRAGMRLMGAANHLIQGGFTIENVGEAKSLLAGATDFFKGLTHQEPDTDQWGLGESDTMAEYQSEGAKNVWMYSGCRDDQTSADASIAGSHVGAMSWAFLECMKMYGPNQSYIQVLQNTRQILKGRYSQIPQLSVGYEQDLNYQIRV